jgi:hypothetical protein
MDTDMIVILSAAKNLVGFCQKIRSGFFAALRMTKEIICGIRGQQLLNLG